MSSPALVQLGPGSQVPLWAEALEQACFGDVWGPLDDGEVLWLLPGTGFARWRAVPAAQEAELIRVAVDPRCRRSGLGGRLLGHGEAMLARMGIRDLHLEVRVANAGARALYEGAGWTLAGTRRAYYRDGEDAALYCRRIPPVDGSLL